MHITAYSTISQQRPPEQLAGKWEHSDRSDAEFAKHLNSVMSWACEMGKAEITPRLFSVMQHLSRTHHCFEFEINDDQFDRLAQWGKTSNSIFGLPDRTLRDPGGAVLVDPEEGNIAVDAVVPYPQDAIERANRNRKFLGQSGIEVADILPPIPSENEILVRSAEEVGWRMLALFIVAVRAESLATKQPIDVKHLRAKSPMAFEALSPLEQSFLDEPSPDEQTIVSFAWRYEALYALQWAVGLHSELSSCRNICDVPIVAETMVDRPDRELITETRLIPTDELLDVVDLNHQMLWAARQARSNGNETPGEIDGGVLSERQHAFNWLIQLNLCGWDDVDTPT